MWMYQLMNFFLLILTLVFWKLCSDDKFAIISNKLGLNKNGTNQGSEKKDFSNNKYFLLIYGLVLVFISGFRGQFSVDYSNYYNYFYQVRNMSFLEVVTKGINTDRGYAIFTKIINFFTDDCTIVMLVVALIIVLCYFLVFKKDSKIVWLSILLLLTVGSYYTSFNTVRSFLVGAMSFFCAKYIYEKKTINYILCALVIATFQKTAIILIPAYFILQFDFSKLNKKIVFILVLLTTILFINLEFFTHMAIRMFYPRYYTSGFGLTTGRSIATLLRPIGFLTFMFINRKYIDYQNIKEKIWVNAVCLFALISIFCVKIDILFRFYYFFLPYITLLIPSILFKMNEKQRKIWIILIVIGCIAYSMLTQWNSKDVYYFIWQNKWFNY